MVKQLSKEVVAFPFDINKAKQFIIEYEASEIDDKDLHSIYLILKYLHEPGGCQQLNALGDFYVDQKKYYLSALCYIESVRLNPSQSDVYGKFCTYKHNLEPNFLGIEKAQEGTISVIMGTYNRGLEIRESIESVLRQSYQDFELIVINDGGNDEVKDILDSFHSNKINYIKLGENRGHAAVLNDGIKSSHGKYIAYLDDDDIYYPNHLESLVGVLKGNGCKIAYTNTKMVKGSIRDGRFQADAIKGCWNVEYDRDKLIENNFISNLCIMHEKNLFSEIGLYREDLRVVMDWEFWLRASLKYDFRHIDIYTGEYRFKESNVTSTQRIFIDFYTELVRNYYLYYRGLVAKLKYLSWQGMTEDARIIYSEIRDGYKEYFKSPDSFEELFKLSSHYHDDAFSNEIAVDYFNRNTREYLRYVNDSKRYGLLVPVSHLIPKKILKVVWKRLERNSPKRILPDL